MLLFIYIKIYSFTFVRSAHIIQTRREENAGRRIEDSDLQELSRGALYIEGGNIMFVVEAIVASVVMAMYVGAEWTAESVLEEEDE